MPVSAKTTYGVQVIPVAPPLHEKVGSVHPELVNAVAASTKPRTTLYFKRDITTPFVEKKCFARGGLFYVSAMRNAMAFNIFALIMSYQMA
ncbi:hypothetical protein A9X05_20830 [Mycobacterium sp. E3298]|nr:hypothetical protein A5704_16430 [Mycobacterium sp. E735]OBG80452.1 hypothetical protein A9X05_20830 [Mycobacterium sp. E3298]